MSDVTSITALLLSVGALVVTTAASYRQLRLAHGANAAQMVFEGLDRLGSEIYRVAAEYVRENLRQNHVVELGITNLPLDAQGHVRIVALTLDDLGKLVAHGAVSEDLAIGAYGNLVREMWSIIGPYAYAERSNYGKSTYVYLEHLASRVDSRPPKMVYKKLGLQRLPPPRVP